MVKIQINNKEYEVPEGITLIQACDHVGIEIPRFCYHDRLSVAGNCRMCLVELEKGPPKPIASCATNVFEGMSVLTNSDMVKKAREGVTEFLLANHPLDCPICDQGGECDLQDQAYFYGLGSSRFSEEKRAVKEKSFGPLIKTDMTRCIHCTRCVRFATEVAGVEEIGAVGRGENMEITTYVENSISSELSGNMIDLCPVGALTSRPYAYTARPWELVKTGSIDIHDAVGSNIRVDSKGKKVMRILPRINESINQEWISDKARFSYDGLGLQRIDRPYIKKEGKLVAVGWEEAIKCIVEKIQEVVKDEKTMAALSGDLADVESLFMLKRLLDNLGVRDYDCRPENSIMKCDTRSSYIFNSTIEGIDEADFFLVIGSNIKNEAAIINSRIGSNVRNNNTEVYNIGAEEDFHYPYIQLGNDPRILTEILNGSHEVAKKLNNAKKPMIILGEQCFIKSDSAPILNIINEISVKYNVISESWNGFNVLHNAASRVGALDLGFVPKKGARDTANIIKDVEFGKVDLVFLLGYDKPNVSKLGNSFNIYIGTHGDEGVSVADVILPASAYTEKTATFVNTEGVVQNTVRAVSAVGEAMEDWRIVNLISTKLGLEDIKSYTLLQSLIKEQCLVFRDRDNVVRDNQLSEYETTKSVDKEGFSNIVENFYVTNVITKNSKTMAKCSKEILNKESV